MAVAMILLWAVVALGVVIALRHFKNTNKKAEQGIADVEGILRNRLAHGEINPDEYQRTLETLRGKR
ncbi:unnamed protein product [Acidithrix sp. C25]|nr:unnamed protein product [Acidithrix sp. C25]